MQSVLNKEKEYDFIVVEAGAAGSVLAADLAASGAQILVIESGGPDGAPIIANPSIWFYNVGGPLDYHLPITPSTAMLQNTGTSSNVMNVAPDKPAVAPAHDCKERSSAGAIRLMTATESLDGSHYAMLSDVVHDSRHLLTMLRLGRPIAFERGWKIVLSISGGLTRLNNGPSTGDRHAA